MTGRITRSIRVTLTVLVTTLSCVACVAVFSASHMAAGKAESLSPERPNILLIVADDLGYTDLGAFGGEIETPNLDALARAGTQFSNFHTAAVCSPTRAMLFSGTDSHVAGLGGMSETLTAEQVGKPGYEGYLNFRVAALSELLRDAGYHTYMAGKWHLGLEVFNSPASRGFERSFALLNGYSGHFKDDTGGAWSPTGKSTYRRDLSVVELPEDFYSTKNYTDEIIASIDSQKADGEPFFAYLAYTAPHWPLQAPAASIAKYAGKYDAGYDQLQRQRLQRLRALGLYGPDKPHYARHPDDLPWDELDEEAQVFEARKMAIFAAMVDDMDRHVGRVIQYLKANGLYENTFIVFMSDNGADSANVSAYPKGREKIEACCDNSLENLGSANSFVWYGRPWAWAATSPYRLYKGRSTEGGIRTPAFVHYPKSALRGIQDHFLTVMDLMPTFLDLAGAQHPGPRYNGREVARMKGKSLLPLLMGDVDEVHRETDAVGWELNGERALRRGDWKAVWGRRPEGTADWQLFNVIVDPAELNDLAERHPDILKDLTELWDGYAAETGVVLAQ